MQTADRARREYEMTEAQLKALLDACKPVMLIALNAGMSSSPQENANRAWAALGREMGFDAMTVEPVSGKGNRFFTAEPAPDELIVADEPKVPEPAAKATPIPMNDCGLTINVGRDGTWLHFTAASGLHVSMNVESMAEGGEGIIRRGLLAWCADRREQASL